MLPKLKTRVYSRAMHKLRWVLLAVSLMRLHGSEPTPIEEESSHERHHVDLFLGAVSRFEGGEKDHGMALGLEYEYSLSQRWGIGGLIEGVTAGHGRQLAMVAPLTWHPWRGLKLSLGPGMEFVEGEAEFLGRASIGYEFRWGRWELIPEISGDFGREAQSLVYGLGIGLGF